MSKYVDVLLVEETDGTPHVVTAPGCTANEGNVVAFNGTMATVVRRAYMDTSEDAYAILSAMIPTYEADAVYISRYEKESKNAP